MATPMEILIKAFNRERSNPEKFAHYFYVTSDLLLEMEEDLIKNKDLPEG